MPCCCICIGAWPFGDIYLLIAARRRALSQIAAYEAELTPSETTNHTESAPHSVVSPRYTSILSSREASAAVKTATSSVPPQQLAARRRLLLALLSLRRYSTGCDTLEVAQELIARTQLARQDTYNLAINSIINETTVPETPAPRTARSSDATQTSQAPPGTPRAGTPRGSRGRTQSGGRRNTPWSVLRQRMSESDSRNVANEDSLLFDQEPEPEPELTSSATPRPPPTPRSVPAINLTTLFANNHDMIVALQRAIDSQVDVVGDATAELIEPIEALTDLHDPVNVAQWPFQQGSVLTQLVTLLRSIARAQYREEVNIDNSFLPPPTMVGQNNVDLQAAIAQGEAINTAATRFIRNISEPIKQFGMRLQRELESSHIPRSTETSEGLLTDDYYSTIESEINQEIPSAASPLRFMGFQPFHRSPRTNNHSTTRSPPSVINIMDISDSDSMTISDAVAVEPENFHFLAVSPSYVPAIPLSPRRTSRRQTNDDLLFATTRMRLPALIASIESDSNFALMRQVFTSSWSHHNLMTPQNTFRSPNSPRSLLGSLTRREPNVSTSLFPVGNKYEHVSKIVQVYARLQCTIAVANANLATCSTISTSLQMHETMVRAHRLQRYLSKIQAIAEEQIQLIINADLQNCANIANMTVVATLLELKPDNSQLQDISSLSLRLASTEASQLTLDPSTARIPVQSQTLRLQPTLVPPITQPLTPEVRQLTRLLTKLRPDQVNELINYVCSAHLTHPVTVIPSVVSYLLSRGMLSEAAKVLAVMERFGENWHDHSILHNTKDVENTRILDELYHNNDLLKDMFGRIFFTKSHRYLPVTLIPELSIAQLIPYYDENTSWQLEDDLTLLRQRGTLRYWPYESRYVDPSNLHHIAAQYRQSIVDDAVSCIVEPADLYRPLCQVLKDVKLHRPQDIKEAIRYRANRRMAQTLQRFMLSPWVQTFCTVVIAIGMVMMLRRHASLADNRDPNSMFKTDTSFSTIPYCIYMLSICIAGFEMHPRTIPFASHVTVAFISSRLGAYFNRLNCRISAGNTQGVSRFKLWMTRMAVPRGREPLFLAEQPVLLTVPKGWLLAVFRFSVCWGACGFICGFIVGDADESGFMSKIYRNDLPLAIMLLSWMTILTSMFEGLTVADNILSDGLIFRLGSHLPTVIVSPSYLLPKNQGAYLDKILGYDGLAGVPFVGTVTGSLRWCSCLLTEPLGRVKLISICVTALSPIVFHGISTNWSTLFSARWIVNSLFSATAAAVTNAVEPTVTYLTFMHLGGQYREWLKLN